MEQYYLIREVVMFLFLLTLMLSKPSYCTRPSSNPQDERGTGGAGFCLSWRLGVEVNNVRAWRTVPTQCLHVIENYMTRGQYERDLNFITDYITTYVGTIRVSDDGFDAWIMDVDDTCISNLAYYRGKRFGCDPYDPDAFKNWAERGACPGISPVLKLFKKLVGSGFNVFLVTGRDEATLGRVTLDNLHAKGFTAYRKLILRNTTQRGQSAVVYKSGIRKELEGEGYRIWGNVGDQWSDLQGDSTGNRTFKLPNPMYFVP